MEPRERPAREGRASSDGDADPSSESAAASSTERLGGSIETLRAREDALHSNYFKYTSNYFEVLLPREPLLQVYFALLPSITSSNTSCYFKEYFK